MTDLTHLRLWALLAAIATVPSLAASDARWLTLTPYPGLSGPGQNSGLPIEAFTAVRSQAQWDKILTQLGWPAPGSASSVIDFEKVTMLVAALGTRPTGGYAVLFQGAFDNGAVIEVSVLEIRPGPNCTAITALTHPIAIALIPRTDRPVRFDVSAADVDCKTTRSVGDGRSSNNRWGV